MNIKKSVDIIKLSAVLLIFCLVIIIYLLNPAFFKELWQVISSGDMQQTSDYINSFGSWAMFFSFWLVVLVNAIGFPPAIIFSAANALVFGLIPGIILSWLGETVGVTISFLLMRFLFRKTAEKIISKHNSLKKIDSFSGHKGFQIMLIARLVPYCPSGILNALGAISRMKLRDYILASLIGKLPSTAIEAMIGHDAMTIDENPHRFIAVTISACLIIGGFWLYERQKKKQSDIDS